MLPVIPPPARHGLGRIGSHSPGRVAKHSNFQRTPVACQGFAASARFGVGVAFRRPAAWTALSLPGWRPS